jgi:glycosidase
MLANSNKQFILKQLEKLYGREGIRLWPDLKKLMDEFVKKNPPSQGRLNFSEKDVVLITYADQFKTQDQYPLKTLLIFLNDHLSGIINNVHILPFYPYSSDDGFSVIDYREVNPEYGTWAHINQIADKYDLMLDAVVNHISRECRWFKDFMVNEPPFNDYFIEVDEQTDLTGVFRPRELPLLTKVETINGEKYVWTTFSEDQIDLNYANPQVLLEIIDLLLFYVGQGARLIRLDAVGYLWKEIGTSCLNLDQSHRIVKILRAVLDEAAPYVVLITETNVPHQENIKYFGNPVNRSSNGENTIVGDEAHMVYQFSLAPLVLHTFLNADVSILSNWAAGLSVPYEDAAYFNFIASHDGIGVTPARGLLDENEVNALIEQTLSHGGQVSYKTNADGSKTAYELNITLFDFLNDPMSPETDTDVNRFLASQVIMLSLAGVPGIYVHSLFGSNNCYPCVEQTGRVRSINREKFNLPEFEDLLAAKDNVHTNIFNAYTQLLKVRRQHPSFHPNASQKILNINRSIFAVLRTAPSNQEKILCLVNVSPHTHHLRINVHSLASSAITSVTDLISGDEITLERNELTISLEAYQSAWLMS